MADAFIRKLVDPSGNVILPATRADGVYFSDNSILQDYVSSNGIVKKSTGDKNGKDITTYISGLKVSGRTITYTYGNGSTGTITTQDTNTTYNAATTSTAGLMSAADKTKLDGIATGANKYTHPAYTARSAGLYKVTVDAAGHVSAVTAVEKDDITALGIPSTNTTYSTFKAATSSAAGGSGLVPAPAAGAQSKFLRGDATWQTPPNTTYSNFKAATASAAGGSGLVPAPAAGANIKYLRGDGTWAVPTNTTYGVATDETNGLMSATDKAKLDGIASGANKYTHPSYTSRTSGLYKITVDASGHVSAATAVTKTDITALGIPSTNTTYANATTSADGLMSSEDKTKLNGIAAGANKYTHPTYTAKSSGFYKVTVDATGHVSATTAVTKTDITNLGIPSTNTTYSTFKAATSSAAGGSGLVPAPAAGAQSKYLRGDATWQTPPNTTYSAATTSTAGLMSAADKTKLNGIATGANNYTHPSFTAKSSGFYKITVNTQGHVSATAAVTAADITNLIGESVTVYTGWGSTVTDLPS